MLKKYRYRYRYRPIAYFLSGQTICLGLLSKTEYRQLPAPPPFVSALEKANGGSHWISASVGANNPFKSLPGGELDPILGFC